MNRFEQLIRYIQTQADALRACAHQHRTQTLVDNAANHLCGAICFCESLQEIDLIQTQQLRAFMDKEFQEFPYFSL